MVNIELPNRGWATAIDDPTSATYTISSWVSSTATCYSNTYRGYVEEKKQEEEAKEKRDRETAAKSRQTWKADRKAREFRQRKWSWNKPRR